MIFTALLWIAAIVLLWRVVVSKQSVKTRAGAAAAAMLTIVGSVSLPFAQMGIIAVYHITNGRDWIALLAAASGPIYLLLWSRKHRGRGRSKTVSILAGIVGLLPIATALAFSILYPGVN